MAAIQLLTGIVIVDPPAQIPPLLGLAKLKKRRYWDTAVKGVMYITKTKRIRDFKMCGGGALYVTLKILNSFQISEAASEILFALYFILNPSQL